mgnify:CR=1 FL=1
MSSSERTESARQEYVHGTPSVSCLRAAIWTESHKETEGEATPVRRAKAFTAACGKLPAIIFPGELIVGSAPPERAGAASGISETGAASAL